MHITQTVSGSGMKSFDDFGVICFVGKDSIIVESPAAGSLCFPALPPDPVSAQSVLSSPTTTSCQHRLSPAGGTGGVQYNCVIPCLHLFCICMTHFWSYYDKGWGKLSVCLSASCFHRKTISSSVREPTHRIDGGRPFAPGLPASPVNGQVGPQAPQRSLQVAPLPLQLGDLLGHPASLALQLSLHLPHLPHVPAGHGRAGCCAPLTQARRREHGRRPLLRIKEKTQLN